MKGLIKKVRENKKGFTLAELLVVVAIVGSWLQSRFRYLRHS